MGDYKMKNQTRKYTFQLGMVKVTITARSEWAARWTLENNMDYKLIGVK